MTDLRLFMADRKKQLADEFEPLIEKRKKLRAELEELTVRMHAMQREWDEIEKAEKAIAGEPEQPTRLTIKEAVLKVLEDAGHGLTAQQILQAINDKFFRGEVPRSSLSPQLSRLKNDDDLVRFDGTLWTLKTQNDEGPATAEPSFLD